MDHKKYHQIQSQIQEARNALQNWNDRRAEAAIELDSIFTEIEETKVAAAAERDANQKKIAELNAALEKSDRDFHKHFEAYTNDMQELKLENSELSQRLKEALNEIESQKQAQKKMEAKYLAKIAEVAAETEVRVADQQYQLKTQVGNLIEELQALRNDRAAISNRAEQYEKELRVIRTQMMSFLNVTKEVAGAEVTAPIVVSASVLNGTSENAAIKSSVEAPLNESSISAAGATSANNNRKTNKLKTADIIVDNLGNAPTTVNDYLKRFGY